MDPGYIILLPKINLEAVNHQLFVADLVNADLVKKFFMCYGYHLANYKFKQTNEKYIDIILMEDNLVNLVEKIIVSNLVGGQQVGIISYNEKSLKKIILNGITTISTDFYLTDESAAQLVMENSIEQIAVPFRITLRESLQILCIQTEIGVAFLY